MARNRQPIELIINNDRKHLTKAEIAERREQEVQPILDIDRLEIPAYLTKTQQGEFVKIAKQLHALRIMGETDVDTLARYIVSRDLYVKFTKKIRTSAVFDDIEILQKYLAMQNKAYNQTAQAARDLGMTISSRCKLVVPKSKTNDDEPVNKFAKFKAAGR